MYNPNTECAVRLLSEGKISHWSADENIRKKLKANGFIK